MTCKLTKAEATELEALSIAFQDAKSALAERLEEIASEWEDEIADKSDKWRDGETGQAAQERLDTLRGWWEELPADGDPTIDTDLLR